MKQITARVTREKLYKKEFISEVIIKETSDNELQNKASKLNPLVDVLLLMVKEEYMQ